MRSFLPLSSCMITTIVMILLLAVSWSAIADRIPGINTCKLSLGLLKPCYPPPSLSLKPAPACCEAAAALDNKITQMNLCYCLKYLQTETGAVNITSLVTLFSVCDVSVKLPPVPIPEKMDCTEYVLEGDSTVDAYWALLEHPTLGFHWELRYRLSTSINSNGTENSSSNSTFTSVLF